MKSSNKYFFKDMSVMFGRSMRHISRSMDTIITVCITPIAMMLLFVYVFGGAIETGTDNYVNYLLPGIMLMAIGSGIAYVAYRLFIDKQRGIFERFHSMPIARSTVLWGHVITSLISNGISVVVIILVALLMGFRSSAGILEWLMVFGILGIFTLALTWVAVIAGLAAKTPDGAGAFSYPIIFLPFISSAFVPTDTMPSVIRAFAENQPVTPIVEAIRNLLANRPVGNDIWVALAWCIAIIVVAYIFAMRIYKKLLTALCKRPFVSMIPLKGLMLFLKCQVKS
jgi:ABC-2 type transport system permease protein